MAASSVDPFSQPTKKKRRPRVPSFAALEITYRCNHACTFCSNVWKDPDSKYPMAKELDGEGWNKVIDNLAKLGVSSFCVTGGEPSTHPEFVSIVKHMCEATYFNYCTLSPCGVGASILTNGDSDVYTPEFAKYLAEQGCQVSVSLLENHLTMGNFERSLNTARVLAENGVHVTGNYTLCVANMNSIAATVERGLEAGLKSFMVMRPMPIGRGNTREGQRFADIDAPTLRSILKVLRDMVYSKGGNITLGCTTPPCVIDTKDVEDLIIATDCGCGSQTLCVDPGGYIRPCTTSAVIGGTIDCVTEALESHEFEQFRGAIGQNRPAKCSKCEHADVCSAGCPASWVVCSDGSVCDHVVAKEVEHDLKYKKP